MVTNGPASLLAGAVCCSTGAMLSVVFGVSGGGWSCAARPLAQPTMSCGGLGCDEPSLRMAGCTASHSVVLVRDGASVATAVMEVSGAALGRC